MLNPATRQEAIALKAASALARQLAREHPPIDWKVLLECALAEGEEQMPPRVPAFTAVRSRVFSMQGVRPEDF